MVDEILRTEGEQTYQSTDRIVPNVSDNVQQPQEDSEHGGGKSLRTVRGEKVGSGVSTELNLTG